MTTIVYAGTHGPDDPTRATLPFHLANGALEAGFKAQIMLIGDATYLMKESVAKEIRGVAVPPLTELLEKVVAGGAELHI
jgi:predicted peroxiredoxin